MEATIDLDAEKHRFYQLRSTAISKGFISPWLNPDMTEHNRELI